MNKCYSRTVINSWESLYRDTKDGITSPINDWTLSRIYEGICTCDNYPIYAYSYPDNKSINGDVINGQTSASDKANTNTKQAITPKATDNTAQNFSIPNNDAPQTGNAGNVAQPVETNLYLTND